MIEPENKTIVRLKITSTTHEPEFVTELLRIEPSRAWRIGEVRPHTVIVEKTHGWLLDSGLPEGADLERHVDTILNRLSPFAKSIKHLSANADVELSCVIYSESSPPLFFSNEQIATLAAIGAGIDIDLYII